MGLKSLLFRTDYFLYKSHLKTCDIKVKSIDRTIDALINSTKSIIRIGDGEIALIANHNIPLQEKNDDLAQRMIDILLNPNDDILVTLPDIFDNLEEYADSTKNFYLEHLFFRRKDYLKYCKGKEFYNTAISRPYIEYKDLASHSKYFHMIKPLWDKKEIVFVEGAVSHNGVDNNLFENASSIERIICPSRDAYSKYDEILSECLKIDTAKLFLVTIGATSKPLVYDLCKKGFRAIDLGNLDMEYDWYINGCTQKSHIAKHDISSIEDNINHGYQDYLNQIIARID